MEVTSAPDSRVIQNKQSSRDRSMTLTRYIAGECSYRRGEKTGEITGDRT
jgi:hypothetical protein